VRGTKEVENSTFQINSVGSEQRITAISLIFVGFRLSTGRFLKLREIILALFPTERKELYYVPYMCLPSGKKITAKGKLWDRYNHERDKLRLSANVSTNRRNSKIKPSVVAQSTESASNSSIKVYPGKKVDFYQEFLRSLS